MLKLLSMIVYNAEYMKSSKQKTKVNFKRNRSRGLWKYVKTTARKYINITAFIYNGSYIEYKNEKDEKSSTVEYLGKS